ncbi:sensor histidine kinase [Jannaschia sp. 2305UL9-9]|uniref:sensor histidine kinase n=1 Tax=Jannaschia sp. 2305UL9-9 TaxID=3121638 RepID=UPI0035273447
MTDLQTPLDLTTRVILETTQHSYLILDRDLVVQAVSTAYCRMTGATEQELLGLNVFEAFPPNPDDPDDGFQRVLLSMQGVLADGRTDTLEVRYAIPDRTQPGRYVNHWWRITHAPLMQDGVITGILQNSMDITSEVTTARDANIREALVDNLSDIAFWEFCPSEGTAIVSEAQSRMFGLPPTPGVTSAEPFINRYLPEDRARLIETFASLEDAPAGTPVDVEYRMQIPDEDIRWVRLRGDLVREDPRDPARFVGISMDVTTARRREEALASTIAERDRLLEQKQLLLDEVNHRIKNSLQIVSSILNLDAHAAVGDEARSRLQGAASRVRAVASVHEMIYKTGQVTTVEIGGYLADLCDTLQASTQGKVTCRSDTLHCSTDKAISLALLTNELVANAFGHAFGDRVDGCVEVTCEATDEGMALTVQDDGIGKQGSSGKGLGTRIIASMVMQLGATMQEGPADFSDGKTSQGGPGPGHRVLVRVPLKD